MMCSEIIFGEKKSKYHQYKASLAFNQQKNVCEIPDERNEISVGQNDSDEGCFATAKRTLYKRIHILQWLPRYTRNDILADFISGLTVGLTMMPQSIAYAGLAGVAPQYGLYTAFIGSFTYIFFGTIKEVSIGPTSLMSLLTASYTIGKPIECVILLTMIAGLVELLMGVLKLGFLVDFISPNLSSGFTSATSLIIAFAQLKNVFGLKMHSHDTIGILKEFSQKYKEIQWPDAVMAVSCFVVLICFKKLLPKIKTENELAKKIIKFLVMSKNAITVLLASLVAAYLHHDGGAPFKLTGEVPQGLPGLALPSLTAQLGNQTVGYRGMVESLGSAVMVVPVVAVLANVAIAKAYSQDVVVDASQEMISLGLANIFGSFVQALPSCGAFTRSAVASSSDVRTPLQGLYSGSLILLALSLLSPYFFFIPKATLAAVLITAASSLLDYEIFPVLWRCNKMDFVLTLSTFILGTLFGVETALIVGAICNIFVLLKVWARPSIYVEVRARKEGGDQKFLYIKPELGLYYVGADYFSECVKKIHKANKELRMIVIDCAHILRLDYSAARTLDALLQSYNENGIAFTLINVHPDILTILKTVTDTEYLSMCETSDRISMIVENNMSEEENPLMSGNASASRRKSSAKSCHSMYKNGERKLSIYEFE